MYGFSNILWDKLKPYCLQYINIGCTKFLNSIGTQIYKNWYDFTFVQKKKRKVSEKVNTTLHKHAYPYWKV